MVELSFSQHSLNECYEVASFHKMCFQKAHFFLSNISSTRLFLKRCSAPPF